MTLGHSDRGDTTNGQHPSGSTTTLASASFTPAVGSLITACGYIIINDASAGASLTPSNTGFTGDGWRTAVSQPQDVGGGYSQRAAIFWTQVTISASGTVVLTRQTGTTDWSMWLQVDEWTGHKGIGVVGSKADALASGTTLTVDFVGTPQTTSGVVGLVGDNNGNATGAVQPTNWTESCDSGDAGIGNSVEAAFLIPFSTNTASPQWTSLQSDVFGKVGVAAEILEATYNYRRTGYGQSRLRARAR